MAPIARVLTFHLPSEQVNALLQVFDHDLGPRYAGHPDFRGLLCLELGQGTSRSQIYVISLWDETMVQDSEDATDGWWDGAAEALGLGIARHHCRVLRDIPARSAASP
jgi:hypothetical protein